MPSPRGGVMLSGGPVLSDTETPIIESDVSSVISISDTLQVSDSEDESCRLEDRKKYRMPDVGKTRLDLRTKEPLSPTPRQPQPPAHQYTPTTPRSQFSVVNGAFSSPNSYGFPTSNAGHENVGDGDVASVRLSRANSIYTLGRASLQGQLSQLTSMKLPDADSLAKRIADIPSSTDAAKALYDASEQIRMWISKASDVLNGLNAEDDVEWAAAGGRDGIDDVDKAINRFERLVEIYLSSIDELQAREDAASLSAHELKITVGQMEGIVASWQRVKTTLGGVKEQVELAMEWEALWNSVLGEAGQEMESLNRLVFEMEEKRHQGAEAVLSSKDSIDLGELETIIEERPGNRTAAFERRSSLPPFAPSSPLQPPPPSGEDRGDSGLLALFARMQPLRASLDFLPMRLATFCVRARPIFPSACLDLDQRREQLEQQWKKVEADAEALRRELGEDRWILVFRNAGRQALKMCESIGRSYGKLLESIDATEHQTSAPTYYRKVENYEAKKLHYGPAVERVLGIIDRGVLDRLTVNGEILRLQSEMRERWTTLQSEMKDMDMLIEDLNAEIKEMQLRDSVSTVVSSERSVGSSLLDTPGSSPASSVAGMSRKSSFQGSQTPTPTPLTNAKRRTSSSTKSTSARPASRLTPLCMIPRRVPPSQSSPITARSASPSPLSLSRMDRVPLRIEAPPSARPRWVTSTKTENRDFSPLSATEPSPYAKPPIEKRTNFLRSTRSSSQPLTPMSDKQQQPRPPKGTPASVSSLPTPSRPPTTLAVGRPRKSSLPVAVPLAASQTSATTPSRPVTSLGGKRSLTTLRSTPASALATTTTSSSSRRNLTVPVPEVVMDGDEADCESPSHHKASGSMRPPSALSGRRLSMRPRASGGGGYAGDVRISISLKDERPKWRP